MTRQRRHFTAEHKVTLLRQHFVEKVPISDICEENGIAVQLFYGWQKIFFDNGHTAFTINDKRRKTETHAKDQQIAQLQDKLQRKHEVLSELMEEYVRLKKALGEP
jgi:transposase-like protein